MVAGLNRANCATGAYFTRLDMPRNTLYNVLKSCYRSVARFVGRRRSFGYSCSAECGSRDGQMGQSCGRVISRTAAVEGSLHKAVQTWRWLHESGGERGDGGALVLFCFEEQAARQVHVWRSTVGGGLTMVEARLVVAEGRSLRSLLEQTSCGAPTDGCLAKLQAGWRADGYRRL